MSNYNTTVISVGNTKEAALYFDHVIPVFLAPEVLNMRKDNLIEPWPTVFGRGLIPPIFEARNGCLERLGELNGEMSKWFIKMAVQKFGLTPGPAWSTEKEFAETEQKCSSELSRFIADFGFNGTPWFVDPATVDDDFSRGDVTVALGSLRLVDISRASWQQVGEFRKDERAKDRLRRLRLFAFTEYGGKDRAYIQDDLLRRIADYEEEAKKWGFETRNAVFTTVLNSKVLAAALGGSLISTLFGEPVAAIASVVGGTAIEFGGIAIEVSRKKFAFQSAQRENPVSYIAEARSRLGQEGN